MKYKLSTILLEYEKNNTFFDSKVDSITWKQGEIPKPFFSYTCAVCSITPGRVIYYCVSMFFFHPETRTGGVTEHLAIEMRRFFSASVAVTDD